MAITDPPVADRPNPALLDVGVPSEHGGWSLTLEPVVLGLIVAPSIAGFLLGVLAVLLFMMRTPLRIVLVDRVRHRTLPRTRLARRVVSIEGAIALALGIAAVVLADAAFWWPLLAATPLLALESWFDARSRSRRLVPELAGSIGVGAVAAAISLAGGVSPEIAAGLWVVIAGRVLTAIPFVRVQLRRAKAQVHRLWHSDLAQVLGVATVGAGWLGGIVPALAIGAVGVLALFGLIAVRRPTPAVPILGAQQVVLGLFVVLVTGLAVTAP